MGVYKLSTAGGLTTPRTNYSSFLAGNPKVTFPSYESIATTSVGSGGTSTVTFSSIPSTYTHLQIRGIARTNRDTYNISNINFTFNSDTGANYSSHYLTSGNDPTSPTPNSSALTSQSKGAELLVGTTVSTNTYGAFVMDILDYANTSKYKTTRILNGLETNGGVAGYAGAVLLISGLWQSTNAINRIDFNLTNGSSITQYSHFALYGVKG
jgi:hypothetical protein